MKWTLIVQKILTGLVVNHKNKLKHAGRSDAGRSDAGLKHAGRSHFKQIIIVKQTLSMKRKRLWKTALNLAVAKSYVKL